MTEHNRGYALSYLLVVFFVVPGAVFGGSNLFGEGDLPAAPGVVKEAAQVVAKEDIPLE